MPPPPTVVPFTRDHLDAAARLLAARHTLDRARHPILPAVFETPEACRPVLEAALGYALGGVAALQSPRDGATREGDHLAGFLLGLRNIPDPTSPSARYAPERASMMFAHGHAVAPGIDPFPTYAALFAALAERFHDAGIFDHWTHVAAGDIPVEQAWANLGFGRANAVATRTLAPLDRPAPAHVGVRLAAPADLDLVDRLVDEEARFHATAPIFRPYLRADTATAVRDALAASLANPDRAHLIATVDGRPAGVISVEAGRGSPLFIPDGAAYIGDTAVLPDARRAGAGVALVAAALEWAREHGYRAATLHLATANPVSTSFWTGLGFVPVMWHLRRRLDPRIAWARPAD